MSIALLMDKSKAPQEHGVMNLGKNCSYCDQLDFLPFTCQYCQKVFCSNHRTEDSHQCAAKKVSNVAASYKTPQNGPTAASLFPNRDADRKKVDTSLNSLSGTGAGSVMKRNIALARLKKFLSINTSSKKEKETSTTSASIGKLFGQSKLKVRSKTAEILDLKKSAKGDVKIPQTDRIYMWCLYISGDTDLTKIDMEKKRKPVFVSNKWPLGRALDSIADALAISNFNNSTRVSDNRLNIFKLKDDIPQLVEPSERTVTAFKTGDTIYLVKGSIE